MVPVLKKARIWGVLHGVTLRGRTLEEALEMALLVQKARAGNLEALARKAGSEEA